MKKSVVIILVVVGMILAIIGSTFGMINGYRDTGIRMEKSIIAVDKNMENIHSATIKKVKGQGMVLNKYSDNLSSIIETYVQGRGGNADVMSMVREAIPNLPETQYTKIMTTIEAGHNEFASLQTDKLDRIRAYEVYLETGLVKSTMLRTLGFPRIDLEELGTVISVGDTKQVFETKEDMDTIDF